MNVMKLGQLKSGLKGFQNRHPKFIKFFMSAVPENAKEGSVLEVRLSDPEGGELKTNIRLTAEDMEFLKEAVAALK